MECSVRRLRCLENRLRAIENQARITRAGVGGAWKWWEWEWEWLYAFWDIQVLWATLAENGAVVELSEATLRHFDNRRKNEERNKFIVARFGEKRADIRDLIPSYNPIAVIRKTHKYSSQLD